MDPITDSPSGATSVVAALRQLIMQGHYAAGERLAEIPVAEALGVSRTPVRLAFRTLEQEGLLEKAGARGFVVREFSEADVTCAVEVRGVLEGLAARKLAETGMTEAVHRMLLECLAHGDRVLARGALNEQEIDAWSRLNHSFHTTIVGSGNSRVIADTIARNNHLPFASADSIVVDPANMQREYDKLRVAQVHHRLIVDALERGESARVEMLMREHAHVGLRYGSLLGAGKG